MTINDYVAKARRMNRMALHASPIKGFSDKCRKARDIAMQRARDCK